MANGYHLIHSDKVPNIFGPSSLSKVGTHYLLSYRTPVAVQMRRRNQGGPALQACSVGLQLALGQFTFFMIFITSGMGSDPSKPSISFPFLSYIAR